MNSLNNYYIRIKLVVNKIMLICEVNEKSENQVQEIKRRQLSLIKYHLYTTYYVHNIILNIFYIIEVL